MELDGDIYLVGLGICELRQVTVETLDVLKRARQVLHLTEKHLELLAINPNVEDLRPRYVPGSKDWDTYRRIAEYVVAVAAGKGPTVLAVDGNPMFFNDITWRVAAIGKEAGLRVEALPAVSALDVLPIQLGFDIGDLGLQVFEATELVLFRLSVNPFLSTLVFQVAEFGTTKLLEVTASSCRFAPLVEHLRRFFPPDHPAIFIRSQCMRDEEAAILSVGLCAILEYELRIEPGMTLYLPRIGIGPMNGAVRETLRC
jgi:uncharacterized protein YabN with tetrapyrrole methylase and pyrophosphatase domain